MLKPQQAPVLFKNNEIIFTFRIYEVAPDEFAGILSSALASELTALMQETSENQPARILVNNGNIVSVVGSDIDVILSDPEGGEVDYNEIAQTPALMSADVQNCMEVIPHEPQSELISTYAAYPGTYDLNTTIRETQQGQQEWCLAYTLAMLLNYRKNISFYNAKSIMRYFYGSTISDIELAKKMLTVGDVMDYAATKENIAMESDWVSNVTEDNLKGFISVHKPVILGFNDMENTNGIGHAILLKGYTPVTFYIWDPQFAYYQNLSIKYPLEQTVYTNPNAKKYLLDLYVA